MNNVIIVSVCAWFISQLIKVAVVLVQKRYIDWHYFITSGGMPSSHSALVSALATSVGMISGFGSVAFGIAMMLALITMYDAAGIRRSVGRQAAVLNKIVKELKDHRPMADLEHNLRELIGHSPLQVIIGTVLGIVVAFLWFEFIA